MSNTARAVTRPRRAARWWRVRPLHARMADARPARWRTPPPGRPLPHFQVVRPVRRPSGGRAKPMTMTRRDRNYERQTGQRITAAQGRRLEKKQNHIARKEMGGQW